MYAIDAALETLLAPVCGREKLLERLAIAEAELEEGIRDRGDTGLRALEIRKLVREAASRVGALAEGDDFGIVRKHLLAAVESVTSTEAPAFLDRLVGLLPELRRAAIEHASNRTEAETLVFNVFRDLLSDPTAAGSDTTALFRRAHWLLMHGRAEGKLGNAEETNRLLHQIKAGQDAAAADIFRLVNGMSMISTELERVPKTEPGLSDMQIPIDPLLQALMQRVQKPN